MHSSKLGFRPIGLLLVLRLAFRLVLVRLIFLQMGNIVLIILSYLFHGSLQMVIPWNMPLVGVVCKLVRVPKWLSKGALRSLAWLLILSHLRLSTLSNLFNGRGIIDYKRLLWTRLL